VDLQRKRSVAIGQKAPFPGFIEPALATAVERVPRGERWLHEIKFDGYRVQAAPDHGEVLGVADAADHGEPQADGFGIGHERLVVRNYRHRRGVIAVGPRL